MADDHYDMHNALRPFDTFDDMVERLAFIQRTVNEKSPHSSDNEIVSAILILAREFAVLNRRVRGG